MAFIQAPYGLAVKSANAIDERYVVSGNPWATDITVYDQYNAYEGMLVYSTGNNKVYMFTGDPSTGLETQSNWTDLTLHSGAASDVVTGSNSIDVSDSDVLSVKRSGSTLGEATEGIYVNRHHEYTGNAAWSEPHEFEKGILLDDRDETKTEVYGELWYDPASDAQVLKYRDGDGDAVGAEQIIASRAWVNSQSFGFDETADYDVLGDWDFAGGFSLNGTSVTATAAELNFLDESVANPGAGHVLTYVGSGGVGLAWQAPSADPTLDASIADVLDISDSNVISADSHTRDAFVFYDFSDSKIEYANLGSTLEYSSGFINVDEGASYTWTNTHQFQKTDGTAVVSIARGGGQVDNSNIGSVSFKAVYSLSDDFAKVLAKTVDGSEGTGRLELQASESGNVLHTYIDLNGDSKYLDLKKRTRLSGVSLVLGSLGSGVPTDSEAGSIWYNANNNTFRGHNGDDDNPVTFATQEHVENNSHLFENVANSAEQTYTIDVDHNNTLADNSFGVNANGELVLRVSDFSTLKAVEWAALHDGSLIQITNGTNYGYYAVYGTYGVSDNKQIVADDYKLVEGTNVLASNSGSSGSDWTFKFTKLMQISEVFDTSEDGLVPGPSDSVDDDNHFLSGAGNWVNKDNIGAVYTEGDGIDIDDSNVISVDYGQGLEIPDGETAIRVDLNGSSLTRGDNGIRINYEGHNFIGNTAWSQMHLRSGVDTTHQDSLVTRHDLDHHTNPTIVTHSGEPNTLANLVEDDGVSIRWRVNDTDGTSFSGNGPRTFIFQPLHEGSNSVSFFDGDNESSSVDFRRYNNTSSHLEDQTNSTVIRVLAENATLNSTADFNIPTYLSINTLEPVETYMEIRRRPASKTNWGSDNATSVDASPQVGTVIFKSDIVDVTNGTYTRNYTMSLVEGQSAVFEKDDMIIVNFVITSTNSSNELGNSIFSFGALDDSNHDWTWTLTAHHYNDILELEGDGDIRLRINDGDGNFDNRKLYDASSDRWFGLPEAPSGEDKYELNVASDGATSWTAVVDSGGTDYTFQDGGTDVSNQSNVDTINFTGTAVHDVSVDSSDDTILDVTLNRLTYARLNDPTIQRNSLVFNSEFDFFDNESADTTTVSLKRDTNFTGAGLAANPDGSGRWTGNWEFGGEVILPSLLVENEVADSDWLVLDSSNQIRRASLPVTEQFNPKEWDYGAINNSNVDDSFQAKNNFQAFKAMNPAEEYNEFEGGENYTYYVSANSNADGYSNGDISRIIRTSGRAGGGFQQGFAVKTFHYDSSGNLTHEYLLWLSFDDLLFSEEDFDALFNNTTAGTRRWTTDDSDNRHPVASGESAGKIKSGDWVGFDLTAFLNNSGHEVQLMGVKRYTYDSNDNLELIEIEGRNPSFV